MIVVNFLNLRHRLVIQFLQFNLVLAFREKIVLELRVHCLALALEQVLHANSRLSDSGSGHALHTIHLRVPRRCEGATPRGYLTLLARNGGWLLAHPQYRAWLILSMRRLASILGGHERPLGLTLLVLLRVLHVSIDTDFACLWSVFLKLFLLFNWEFSDVSHS